MKKFIIVVIAFMGNSILSQGQKMTVSKVRLSDNLKRLRVYGINEMNGNDRVAYSDYDIQAREYLKGYLKNLGLTVEVDYAANIIARKEGVDKKLKPIAFGSHIDAVPNGGHYDGPLGVIGGIEALETILDNKIITFLTDASKFKKNKFTPITRIPIKDDNQIMKYKKIYFMSPELLKLKYHNV